MNFIPLLQATQGQGGGFMTIVMFVLIFVIFYIFIIRPQSKKQKETERMINAIKKGDKVITIGGLHGEVTAVREKTFVIKVEDGSKLEFSRSAISTVVNVTEEAEKPAKKPAKESRTSKAEKLAQSSEDKEKEEKEDTAESAPQEESADNSGKNE